MSHLTAKQVSTALFELMIIGDYLSNLAEIKARREAADAVQSLELLAIALGAN
jgi:hypothetical protein